LKKPNKQNLTDNPKSAPKKKASVRSSRVAMKRGSTESRLRKSRINQRSAHDSTVGATTNSPSITTPPAKVAQSSWASGLQTNILRVVALLVVIGITYYIFSIRDRIAEFEQYGYVGIFVVALLANATVLIPAPGLAIISAMGSVFNPLGVGLAAGTGGAIGELSGYLAGFSGQAIAENTQIYNRIKPWVEKFGGWAILVLSAIPNPFFDAAGIAAGIVKMPLRTFLISAWIGQIIKMTFFAYAGQSSYQAIQDYFK
jgi:uncharacterized membrane protein YdjX (TVP38/TMEM64 family)